MLMCGSAACYFFSASLTVSLTPPIAFWTLPLALSARPSDSSFASPTALPTACLTEPLISFTEPAIRSLSMATILLGQKLPLAHDAIPRRRTELVFESFDLDGHRASRSQPSEFTHDHPVVIACAAVTTCQSRILTDRVAVVVRKLPSDRPHGSSRRSALLVRLVGIVPESGQCQPGQRRNRFRPGFLGS